MRRFARFTKRFSSITRIIKVINRDLQLNPYWQAKDLGQPLPNSPHAVSVALPTWKDVIAYEEKDPKCLSALQAIYPRFGFNPLIAQIANKSLKLYGKQGQSSWPYPNSETAEKAKIYCQKINPGCFTQIKELSNIQCLIVDSEATPVAKEFWQHTGLGASSRLAAIALKLENAPQKDMVLQARVKLKDRLAKLYACQPELVHLQPSGMAALTTALQAVNRIKGAGKTLQIGFPYVDVLKLPDKIFHGSDLLVDVSPSEIETTLDKQNPTAIVIELPSNPMLQCVDLVAISNSAQKRGIPLIVDDTIGSPININVIPYADIVFSSLTKSFAGRGDILAGGLVISPYSRWKKQLSKIIPDVQLAPLSDPDVIALEETSRDINTRLSLLNEACLELKRKLETLPEISRVLHPENCANFNKLLKANGGYGCLLSFELNGGIEKTKKVYDFLKVNKGPSLGTNFTLVCPYVLLAHYGELGWAARCGVPSHLLRVSVGLEDSTDLWERFYAAIKK